MKVTTSAVKLGVERPGNVRGVATFARPASRTTAKALDAVRGAILNGELSPGEQLRQQVWAQRCGVSRPPVREALEILSNEGLRTHGLNQGYFVAKFSNDEVEQLYTMRELMETEAIRTLEWPGPEVLAELSTHVDRIASDALVGRPDLAREAMADFYLSIYRLCHRTLIVAEIEWLWVRTASYRAQLRHTGRAWRVEGPVPPDTRCPGRAGSAAAHRAGPTTGRDRPFPCAGGDIAI